MFVLNLDDEINGWSVLESGLEGSEDEFMVLFAASPAADTSGVLTPTKLADIPGLDESALNCPSLC